MKRNSFLQGFNEFVPILVGIGILILVDIGMKSIEQRMIATHNPIELWEEWDNLPNIHNYYENTPNNLELLDNNYVYIESQVQFADYKFRKVPVEPQIKFFKGEDTANIWLKQNWLKYTVHNIQFQYRTDMEFSRSVRIMILYQ